MFGKEAMLKMPMPKSQSEGQLVAAAAKTDPMKRRSGSPPTLMKLAQREFMAETWPKIVYGSASRAGQRRTAKMVPLKNRREFFRHSAPSSGPMAQPNIDEVIKHFAFKQYIEGAENRSVTLAQMMQIQRFVETHCRSWHLNFGDVNHYDLSKWLIKPLTYETNTAFVEHIAEERQPPSWFASHWWGEPIVSFYRSIRRHIAVRGLSPTTLYWVHAYAARQHAPQNQPAMDPMESAFYKALQTARFKVLLVHDGKTAVSGPATPLSRLWCSFECSMCLGSVTTSMDIAVCSDDEVEMVTSGMTRLERTSDTYLPGKGMLTKTQREASFPMEIVKDSLQFDIRFTETSRDVDRTHILNCIAGRDLEEEVEEGHERYHEANLRLRSFFALIFWHKVLCLDWPDKLDEDAYKAHTEFLATFTKAISSDIWRTQLSVCLAGCQLGGVEATTVVMDSLPPNLTRLSMDLQHSGIGDRELDLILTSLPKSLEVLSLDLAGCPGVTDRGIKPSVRALPRHVRALSINLVRTSVSDAVKELMLEPLDKVRDWAKSIVKKKPMPIPSNYQGASAKTLKQLEARQAALEHLLKTRMTPEVKDKVNLEIQTGGPFVRKVEKRFFPKPEEEQEQEQAEGEEGAAAAAGAEGGKPDETTKRFTEWPTQIT